MSASLELDYNALIELGKVERSVFDSTAAEWEAKLSTVEVTNHEDHAAMSGALGKVAEIQKVIHEHEDPVCNAAHTTWRIATSKRKEILAPWDKLEMLIKKAIGGYVKRQAIAAAEKAKAATQERMAKPGELIRPASNPVTLEPPKAAGSTTRMTPVVEVTDMKVFLRAIANGKIPANAIEVQTTWLNGQARQLGDSFDYAGCSVSMEPVVSKR